MANFWYGLAVQEFAAGSIAWSSNTIQVSLVSSLYTPAQNTDQYYSVAVSSGIVAAGVTLTSKTNSLGKLSAANTTWSSVTGSQVTQLVGYVDGNNPGTNDYILFNLSSGTNLPVTPNGGNITATWDPTNGIGTLMAGLDARDRSLINKLREWFNDVLKIPARRTPGGLWLPEPTLVLG
jgi:hypothetical protein